MVERQHVVAPARHLREAERLSIAQIAERRCRSPATVKAYFYDPTGEKAWAVKARHVGVCTVTAAPPCSDASPIEAEKEDGEKVGRERDTGARMG